MINFLNCLSLAFLSFFFFFKERTLIFHGSKDAFTVMCTAEQSRNSVFVNSGQARASPIELTFD